MQNPIGKNREPRRKALPFSRLLPFFDFEVQVFDIGRLAVVVTLCPARILFDNLVELIEKFPVGIDTCAFHFGTGIAHDFALKETGLFHALKTSEDMVERLI
jgi:hypothetical protein